MTAWPELKEKLLRPVTEIWDNRTVNCLTKDGIVFTGQMYFYSKAEYLRIPNFGKLCLGHVKNHLEGNELLSNFSENKLEDYFDLFRRRTVKSDLNSESSAKEVQKYYESEHFAQMQIMFGEYLEKHKEYFQLIADPNGQVEIAAEKQSKTSEIEKQEQAVQQQLLVQYPSTQDWIIENLPSELREGLKPEFLEAVLNSPVVRAKVQKVVSEAVAEKLGFDFKV